MIKNKIKAIFTTGVVLMTSISALADGWGEFRKNTSEDCPSGNKWRAVAEVKCNFINGWTRKSQEVCEPYCANADIAIGTGSNRRAYQKTTYGKICGFTSTGFTTKKRCYRGCSYFDMVNYLGMQITTEDTTEGPDASESSFIRVNNTEINSAAHSITLTGISGYERINTSDFYGSFKIVVWLTDNDLDSNLTEAKTLWTAEVRLENGVISYNNFSNSEVTLNSTDSGFVMLLNNFNKTIQLANTIDMNRVAVRIISHAEESLASSLPSLLSNKSIVAPESEGTLLINPTSIDDNINVVLNTINSIDYSNAKVLIFDETGKEVFRSSCNLTVSENKFTVSGLQLSAGSYYFVLNITGNINYVKKFIKQ